MNIFYLHHIPSVAAEMHCDKHVVKMIVESCQMLATAHHEHGNGDNVTYKPTHKNHPSSIWARETGDQYRWLHKLALALCKEYTLRYGKEHKCLAMLKGELLNPPSAIANNHKWKQPPQCMPDEHKHYDTVVAYRSYYLTKDSKWARTYYRGRNFTPNWMEPSYA